MYKTSDSNLVWATMNLFDTFTDDFSDEKYMKTHEEMDIRAQIEVTYLCVIFEY